MNPEKTSLTKAGDVFALGHHVIVEFYDCDPLVLVDPEKVEKACVAAAEASGATVLDTRFTPFEPQGVSGFVLIAESHFSIHAWPEHDYAAVDIFTCGESIDFNKGINRLKDELGADSSFISADMNRGVISNNGVERMVPVCEDTTHVYSLSWRERFEKSNAWGLLTSVDVYNCDPDILRDDKKIRNFVLDLCDKIEMKRYGDCVVVDFGEDEKVSGFSMTQLIESSLVSGHFANATNTAYLDVFSCKFFEPRDIAELAISFFRGRHYKMQVALRR